MPTHEEGRMIISTTVQLNDPDESFAYTPEAAAAQVLAALGGNATKDTSYVNVMQNVAGMAGVDPNPPVAEPPA
jgi:hypothetical protein